LGHSELVFETYLGFVIWNLGFKILSDKSRHCNPYEASLKETELVEEKMVSAEWLKRTELFSTLEESQLNIILSHSSVESCLDKKTIFHQGDEAHRLYILIEGVIGLTVKTGEKVNFMTSTIDKEGSVFGMPSLLEPFRYNVTATCLKPSKILMIEANHIRKRMEQDTRMGMEIMKKLALIYFNRLNEMREGISKLVKVFKSKTP